MDNLVAKANIQMMSRQINAVFFGGDGMPVVQADIKLLKEFCTQVLNACNKAIYDARVLNITAEPVVAYTMCNGRITLCKDMSTGLFYYKKGSVLNPIRKSLNEGTVKYRMMLRQEGYLQMQADGSDLVLRDTMLPANASKSFVVSLAQGYQASGSSLKGVFTPKRKQQYEWGIL